MIFFLDASAMVAIITDEARSAAIEQRFGNADEVLCSAVSLWETARAIARKRKMPLTIVHAEVEDFVADFGLRLVPIGHAENGAAIDAHDRYGKGTEHPARLNMGDCFAYACARTNEAGLLYKGDDFARTDLA